MKLSALSPQTQDGLRLWAKEVHGDEMMFDDSGSAPEFWAWIWFQLRESSDRREWFPLGRSATIQHIELLLTKEAEEMMVAMKGRRGPV